MKRKEERVVAGPKIHSERFVKCAVLKIESKQELIEHLESIYVS